MVTEKYLRSLNREFCVFYFQDLLKVSVTVIQEKKKVLNSDLAVFLDGGGTGVLHHTSVHFCPKKKTNVFCH
jgi:hypothetical protein